MPDPSSDRWNEAISSAMGVSYAATSRDAFDTASPTKGLSLSDPEVMSPWSESLFDPLGFHVSKIDILDSCS